MSEFDIRPGIGTGLRRNNLASLPKILMSSVASISACNSAFETRPGIGTGRRLVLMPTISKYFPLGRTWICVVRVSSPARAKNSVMSVGVGSFPEWSRQNLSERVLGIPDRQPHTIGRIVCGKCDHNAFVPFCILMGFERSLVHVNPLGRDYRCRLLRLFGLRSNCLVHIFPMTHRSAQCGKHRFSLLLERHARTAQYAVRVAAYGDNL
jgi:hypothetical protein